VEGQTQTIPTLPMLQLGAPRLFELIASYCMYPNPFKSFDSFSGIYRCPFPSFYPSCNTQDHILDQATPVAAPHPWYPMTHRGQHQSSCTRLYTVFWHQETELSLILVYQIQEIVHELSAQESIWQLLTESTASNLISGDSSRYISRVIFACFETAGPAKYSRGIT
jgi:hypothetical protein